MRALIWVVQATWAATVDQAAALLPAQAEVTLLCVVPGDVEGVIGGARAGLLGRHPPPPPPHERRLGAISEEAAHQLLSDARARFGRDATTETRHGRVEREVVAAAAEFDLLVMARDGDPGHPGPRSLGPHARFVLDHAPCQVLLVWATVLTRL